MELRVTIDGFHQINSVPGVDKGAYGGNQQRQQRAEQIAWAAIIKQDRGAKESGRRLSTRLPSVVINQLRILTAAALARRDGH